jgi:transcriptional regulator with XRE-family HTH domain
MKEDMEHVGFSQVEFAQRMGYTAKHIHKLIKGEASITADTALKLEKVLSYPSHSALHNCCNLNCNFSAQSAPNFFTALLCLLQSVAI